MAEVSSKQQFEELLRRPASRGIFDEVVEAVYSSFRTVDWADEFAKEMIAGLESASDDERRDLHERIGILSFAMGWYQRAVEHLEKVKSRKEATHFLGRAYLELGRPEESAAALQAGRKANGDFQTDMLLAQLHCMRRDADGARKLCESYEKDFSEDPRWFHEMGRALEVEGAYEEAMAHFEKALERDPEHRESLFRLAMNCDLNGEDERAVELYERCASLKPTCVGALVNLGVLYEDSGRYNEAIQCYKRVLAIDPSHQRAQLFLKDAEASLIMHVDEDRTQLIHAQDEALQLPLANFEISARSRNALEKLNVRTLGDLARVTEEQLLQFKNFGETSLDEIKDLLIRNNLQMSGSGPPVRPQPRQLAPSSEDQGLQEKLSTPVELLGLSTRCRKCMDRLRVATVGELINCCEKDLLATANFGRTSVAEIKSKLAGLGLALSEE